MRSILFTLLTLICVLETFPLAAQTLLNNPESIVYDAPRNRYIVSNWGDGKLVQIDQTGDESYFDTTFTRLAGLYILHDTLYVATNLDPYVGVAGFDLAGDSMAFFIEMPESGLTNDITSDSANNIYVTDFYNSKLYKIREGERSFTTFVDSGLNWPNGIIYDRFHHRLLLISQHDTGGPILSVNIGDSTLGFIAMTGYSGVDGLELDNEGRLYFSTWQTDQTLRFSADYTSMEVIIEDNLDPADIYINPVDSTLCVPNFSRNDISYTSLATTSSLEHSSVQPGSLHLNSYPNPFNNQTTLCFEIPASSNTVIKIFDMNGREVHSQDIAPVHPGTYQVPLHCSSWSSGMYLAQLLTGQQAANLRLLLVK